jgi:hypothetical protein
MLIAKQHSDATRRQYRKPVTGQLVYVYEVTGSTQEMEDYKEAQGEHFREDEVTGSALFFTVRPFITPSGVLGISQKGDVYQDTSELDKIEAIVTNKGGNFGDILAEKLLGNLLGAPSIVSEAAPAEKQPAEGNPGDF